MKSWAAKYKDAGLVVIGVHTPEFGFEKERANVENAVREFKVTYPVAIDSDHGIWQAFNNEYWPARLFHRREGTNSLSPLRRGRICQVRARHPGTSEGERSHWAEWEHGSAYRPMEPRRRPASMCNLPKPTSAMRRSRAFRIARTIGSRLAKDLQPSGKTFLEPMGVGRIWKVGAESAVLQEAPGKIVFRFHSRDLHMVLAPPKDGKPVRFKVTLDGAAPGDDHGV